MIPSINREESAQLAVDLVTLVLENPFEEVIGLGMDYLETCHPPEKFWKAYLRSAGKSKGTTNIAARMVFT